MVGIASRLTFVVILLIFGVVVGIVLSKFFDEFAYGVLHLTI